MTGREDRVGPGVAACSGDKSTPVGENLGTIVGNEAQPWEPSESTVTTPVAT